MQADPASGPPDRRARLEARIALVHAVLEDAGIWHCLAFGSLLGAVRDGRAIAWDHDIDLWVRPCDRDAILAVAGDHGVSFSVRTFEGSQLAVNPGRVPAFDPGVLAIRIGGSIVGELWAPTVFADGVLRLYDLAAGVYFWPQSSMPHHHFQTREEAELDGHRYPVPGEAEALLAELYGEDWRTPIRAPADRGRPRPGREYSGEPADPRLRAWIARCEAAGWDRSCYGGEPAWPRPTLGAGPRGAAVRARDHSGSAWWRTIEELQANY